MTEEKEPQKRPERWKRPDVGIIKILKSFQCRRGLEDHGWTDLDTGEPMETLDAVEWYEIREFSGVELQDWYGWLPRETKDQLREESVMVGLSGEDFDGIHIDVSELAPATRTMLAKLWKEYWLYLHEDAEIDARKEYADWEIHSDTGARCLWRRQSVRSILLKKQEKPSKFRNLSWGKIIVDGEKLIFPGKDPWKPVIYDNLRRKSHLRPAATWECALEPSPAKKYEGKGLESWKPIVGDPSEMFVRLSHYSVQMVRRSDEWVRAFYASIAMLARLLELV